MRWVRRWAIGSGLCILGACSGQSSADCFVGENCRDAGPIARTADASEPVLPEMDAAIVDAAEPVDAAESGPADAGPPTGETFFYVMDQIDLGVLTAGLVAGFDLDGVESDADDPEGCYQLDYTSPAPDSARGVDNILGPVLSDQEATLGIRSGLVNNVVSGELIVLLQVRYVDSFEDDGFVELGALFGMLPAGVEEPRRVGSVEYLPGQTFDVDSRSLDADGEPIARLLGEIVDGRLRVGPGGFRMRIPWQGALVEFDVTHTEVRFDISETGIEVGVLGGALDIESTLDALAAADPPGYQATLVELLLRGVADLFPNVDGDCQSASMGLVFSGTTAVRGLAR